MWYLRWTPYALSHLTDPLFTRHLNYPDGVNLMWNTPVFVAGLLLWPVTQTLGPVVAYNLFLTLDVALSAWCAYLVLRRYCRARVAALVGAALYGFSPYVISHAMQHANLSLAAIPPLLVLLIDEIAVRRRRSPLLLGFYLGLLAAAQLLLAEEMLATETLLAVVALVALAAMYPAQIRSALNSVLSIAPAVIVTFAALAGWPLELQFLGPQRISGSIWDPSVFATDLLNFVVPTQAQSFAPPAAQLVASHFSELEHEATGYLGLPLILLLAFTVGRWWDRPAARVAAIVGAVAATLSLGPHLIIGGQPTGVTLPWALLAHVPILANILPGRLTVFMYLCVAILVAVFVDGVIAERRWRVTVPGLLLLAFALLPLLPRWPFPTSSTVVPPIFTAWQRSGIRPGAVVLVAPRAEDGAGDAQMLWQAMAGDAFRMPDGYFFAPNPRGGIYLNTPPATLFTSMDSIQIRGETPVLSPTVRHAIDRDLRTRDIHDVVVGPMQHHDLMMRFFTDLFDRPPKTIGGVQIWRDVLVATRPSVR